MLSSEFIHTETRKLGLPVPLSADGRRIDEYLAAGFPFFSRSGWQREIIEGRVLVNGMPRTKSSYRLRGGDEVRRLHPISEEPDVDTNLQVLWTDGDIAILNKPSGLPMHESGYFRRKTVYGILPDILGSDWSYVHRLDRETSGILVCARTHELRSMLGEMWTERAVKKSYLCVTSTLPPNDSWIVDAPILAERHLRTNKAEIHEDGDEAFTEFSVISRGEKYATIEARPITGRTNQIRLHLSHVNLSLVGEKVYGVDSSILEIYRNEGNTERVQSMAGFPRHALHAWKIRFTHPLTRMNLDWVCPPSADLNDVLSDGGYHTPINGLDDDSVVGHG
jgi:23S rRNA pseudouridine1911/1915/1917 synthase